MAGKLCILKRGWRVGLANLYIPNKTIRGNTMTRELVSSKHKREYFHLFNVSVFFNLDYVHLTGLNLTVLRSTKLVPDTGFSTISGQF